MPAGYGLLTGLFGPGDWDKQWPQAPSSIFDTGDGRSPWGTTTDAWNALRLGYGVKDAPEALQAGMLETRGRYLGGPNNGSWSDRWQQWFGTDVTDPRTGRVLLSPQHQTGLRVGQDYGARDPATGAPLTPANNELFSGFTWTQNQLARNPYLDPANQVSGFRGLYGSSPYGTPDPRTYLSTMRQAGGAGDVDFYGQRGVGQMEGLSNSLIDELMRGIDTESQRTLATQLPEIQNAFASAGMGRSGAGGLAMLQAQQDILAQANRDKQRTLADFQNQTLGRRAEAINLGSQIGAQGVGAEQGRLGQAALAGLGDQFAMDQSYRGAEQNLYAQAMQNQLGQYGMDLQGYLNALTGGGQYALGALEQERLGQSQALQDYTGMVYGREGWQQNAMDQYMQTAEQYRAIEQERLNQMLQSGMLPLNLMLQIATGTTGGAPIGYGSADPWGQVAADTLGGFGQAAGGWLGQGLFGEFQ